MARTRTLSELRADAYKRSDNEGTDASDGRHPTADVTRYVNQGGAELWDLLIEARGRSYFRVDPAYSFSTTADTSEYSMPSTFYLLISARVSDEGGEGLVPFDTQEEPFLRDSSSAGGRPLFYDLRRAHDGTTKLVVLPEHDADLTIKVDYVRSFADMSGSSDQFDGLNGWEEYVVDFAAHCMATKDEEWELVKALDNDMARLRQRIMKLAPKRDLHRARRTKDVRGARAFGRRWW